MKIYSIINVIQLKSKASKINSYNRSLNFELLSIVEADIKAFFFVLKRILNKRISRGQVYYLIKWKNYDNEHNVWYSVRTLNDVQELITEYEANVERKIQLDSRWVQMLRRKFFTTNQASSIHQSEIKIRIFRRTAFRSTILIKREAKFGRRQSSK